MCLGSDRITWTTGLFNLRRAWKNYRDKQPIKVLGERAIGNRSSFFSVSSAFNEFVVLEIFIMTSPEESMTKVSSLRVLSFSGPIINTRMKQTVQFIITKAEIISFYIP